MQRVGGFVAYVRGRTRFFDEQVRAAVSVGPCQIVIIGAGYDDRAQVDVEERLWLDPLRLVHPL